MLHSIGSAEKRAKETPFKVQIRSKDDTFEIEVFSWTTLHVLKEMIQAKIGVKLKDQRIFYDNQELIRNNQNMFDYNISKGTVLYLLQGLITDKREKSFIKPTELFFDLVSPDFVHVINEVKKSFASNINPQLTENGTSGTYLLKNMARVNIAIFKPFDEEPYADNNPKGYPGKLGSPGFRAGIRSGESASREVAAYLLDRKGFHNVPETIFAEIRHHYFSKSHGKKTEDVVKYGSLQLFKKHHDIAGNYGPMLFSAKDVHRIAILDIRILNCDRNEENILIKKVNPAAKSLSSSSGTKAKSYDIELIPIDHGLSFPDTISICSYEMVWMEWPQIQQPFTKEEMDFINSIDPDEDAKFLQKHLKFRDICLRNFRIAEILLKKCAKEGLTIYQIGTILYKDDPDEQSEIEKIIAQAESMFEFTKRSVEQTIFVTNLIKKTRFMSKSSIINGINGKKTGNRLGFSKKNQFEEKKTSAKDDHSLVYGEKDRFQYNSFKRKMHRNYSTKSNLNEMEVETLQMQLFSQNPKPIIEEREESECSASSNEDEDYDSFEKKTSVSPSKKDKNQPTTAFLLKKNISNAQGEAKLGAEARKIKKNTVKKVISMPNLLEGQNGKSSPIADKTRNGVDKKPQYDEIFFYYFESFLDQFLLKKLNRKRLSSQG